MSVITICLTNWKRPENLHQIIGQLRRQSLPVQIFLWNNGERFDSPWLDWQVDSSLNKVCAPRWFMAASADTDFVCILDDDLFLADDNIMSDMINIAHNLPDDTIIGPTGVKLVPGLTYRDAHHLYSFRCEESVDTPCDIIKGSLMLMRTSALRKHINLDVFNYCREEDIIVSALLAEGKRNHHLCLTSFGDRFRSVGNDAFALWRQEGHMEARQSACMRFFI